MTEPRTTSGRAALSALRPHIRRALARTILAIESEAASPYAAALRQADEALARVAAVPGIPADVAAAVGAARDRTLAVLGSEHEDA